MAAAKAPVKKELEYSPAYMRANSKALIASGEAKDADGHFKASQAHMEAMLLAHKARHAEQTEYHRKQSNLHAEKFKSAGGKGLKEMNMSLEKNIELAEAMARFGPKAAQGRRLPSGTKVMVNRPTHTMHGTTGTVAAHGPTHVTVTYSDGSRHDHPLSAIHHPPTEGSHTFESKTLQESNQHISTHVEEAPGASHSAHHHLEKIRAMQASKEYGASKSWQGGMGETHSEIHHLPSGEWHKVHSSLDSNKVTHVVSHTGHFATH